jgi:hypothetical protein
MASRQAPSLVYISLFVCVLDENFVFLMDDPSSLFDSTTLPPAFS